MIEIPKRMFNRKNELPSIDALLAEAKRIYKYDDINGGLIWKAINNPNHPGQAKIGNQVGGDDGHGYRMCMLLGHKFKVHQIVWLLNNNVLPHMPIDHIDRDKKNNRLRNLRLVTDQQNIFNQSSNAREFSGVRKYNNRFRSIIELNGKKISLGIYDTKEEASQAYKKASREIRGEFSPV